jgi:hypothetical protein
MHVFMQPRAPVLTWMAFLQAQDGLYFYKDRLLKFEDTLRSIGCEEHGSRITYYPHMDIKVRPPAPTTSTFTCSLMACEQSIHKLPCSPYFRRWRVHWPAQVRVRGS